MPWAAGWRPHGRGHARPSRGSQASQPLHQPTALSRAARSSSVSVSRHSQGARVRPEVLEDVPSKLALPLHVHVVASEGVFSQVRGTPEPRGVSRTAAADGRAPVAARHLREGQERPGVPSLLEDLLAGCAPALSLVPALAHGAQGRHPDRPAAGRRRPRGRSGEAPAGSSHQVLVENGGIVEILVPERGFHRKRTPGVPPAEPPGPRESLADAGLHDAALDEPPEVVDLSIGRAARPQSVAWRPGPRSSSRSLASAGPSRPVGPGAGARCDRGFGMLVCHDERLHATVPGCGMGGTRPQEWLTGRPSTPASRRSATARETPRRWPLPPPRSRA